MNDKELLDAVKLAAGVPADGWGVTWNPLYNPGHCQELIASKRVRIEWQEDQCWASVSPHTSGYREFFGWAVAADSGVAPTAALRRAVCRAVVGGAA